MTTNSAAKRVLFLNFDGVLHPAPAIDLNARAQPPSTGGFRWISLLAGALKPHRDVGIVVHSVWRYNHDLGELRELLGTLGVQFLGATPLGPRYESTQWWLHLNPAVASHRILDDAQCEFPVPLPAELIVCHPLRGISDPQILASLQNWLSP